MGEALDNTKEEGESQRDTLLWWPRLSWTSVGSVAGGTGAR